MVVTFAEGWDCCAALQLALRVRLPSEVGRLASKMLGSNSAGSSVPPQHRSIENPAQGRASASFRLCHCEAGGRGNLPSGIDSVHPCTSGQGPA
jgi:hypothetical protein